MLYNILMKRVGLHILFWTAYALFKTYLNVSASSDAFFSDQPIDWPNVLLNVRIQILVLVVKLPLVYFTFFLFDQFIFKRWSLITTVTLSVVVFTISSIALTLLYKLYILPIVLNYQGSIDVYNINSLIYYFFTLIFVVGVASSFRLLKRQYQSKIKEAELQKEKTQAELKYLKGQINPHFLFNTLNNIYSLARKGSDQTSDAVLKLSKLMRFMLYEASNDTILITDELKLIQDYIALEKLRYGDRLRITYEEVLDNPQQTIAPLMLIHFIENAFKHGASESRFDSFIHIKVTLMKGLLQVVVTNSKADTASKPGSKIGLENIRRQLELVYPKHELTFQDDPDKFTVSLTLPLAV